MNNNRGMVFDGDGKMMEMSRFRNMETNDECFSGKQGRIDGRIDFFEN